jgi:hypothetical protein
MNQSKISNLMQADPKGLVMLSSWLVANGYSHELQQQYRRSGWLKSIGKGAMLKSGDPYLLSGALAALQSQANLALHVGGRTALALQGQAHYLQLATSEVTLFTPGSTKLPKWFLNNKWDSEYTLFNVTLFKNDDIGLIDYPDSGITMKIATTCRSMMECLSICPKEFSLMEAYELMEGLTTLRPNHVQDLLEGCTSIKTKRLFLYFAERAKHSWFKYIDTSKIDLGSGNRSLVENGSFISKYLLVLPKVLA